MIDTKELRRLARASTPGEWLSEFTPGIHSDGRIYKDNGSEIAIICGRNYGQWRDADDDGDSEYAANAAFIAAANPSAILSLLDKIDGLVSALQMAKHVVDANGTQAQLEEIFAALESMGVKP